jgi:hypothetical protein
MNQSRRKDFRSAVLPAVVCAGIFSSGLNAQSTTPPASVPSDADRSVAPAVTPPVPASSHNRVFYVLPNFWTVDNQANVPPLTSGQKFKLQARTSFDVMQLLWYGVLAGVGQATNSDAGYGQGAAGYAKRYGARFADSTIEDFTVRVAMASLFRQDPRYFRMGKGTVWHRTTYAVSRIVVTRSDSGEAQFNYSELFGSATAAGISTFTYHPRGERTLSNALTTWGSQVGYDCISAVIYEFWPDVRHALHH